MTYQAFRGPFPSSFSSVAVHEMGLPRNAKKGGPRDPGEESLEEVFWEYFKRLSRLSLHPWGSVHQEKFDEDLFFCFPLFRNQ